MPHVHIIEQIKIVDTDGDELNVRPDGAVTAAQGAQGTAEDAWFARDDYDDQEDLDDQSGTGVVLTFAFSAEMCMVIVTSQGGGLVARATASGADPSATKGQPCFDQAATYLPVRTSVVKVFAPAGTTISVVGLLRS